MDPQLITDNTATAYPSSMSLYARYLNNRKSKEARHQQHRQHSSQSSNKSSSILPSSSPRSSALAKKMATPSQRSSPSLSASAMATINYLRSASMFQTTTTLCLILLLSTTTTCQAFLYQPINYMLDDSALVSNGGNDNLDHASLSPIYNDQSGSSALSADRDIAKIIGEGLARWRDGRNVDQQQYPAGAEAEDQMAAAASNYEASIIPADGQSEANGQTGEQQQSVSSSVAEMVLNGMSVLASAANQQAEASSSSSDGQSTAQRSPSIIEIDTSSPSATSEVSKADLKGTRQWFNPKDNIPALRISSMATPSKHKKVYFRSEKKLLDDSMDKSSLIKPFNGFNVQRRSSRGSSSPAAPQSLFQNGVIDFLKKFREVYIQTRPIQTASGPQSAASSLASAASNIVAAAASSPAVASALAPSSSGSSPSSKPSSMGSGAAGGLFGVAGTGPNKSPLTPQKYMSFWSKQFPTWVRKVLKQIRRSTLKASQNKRQQQQSTISQASGSSAAGTNAENSANQH